MKNFLSQGRFLSLRSVSFLLCILYFFSCYALTDAQIQTSLRAYMTQDQVPGMAVLLYQNGTLHRYYLGEANPISHTPVSENTIFELGSITKTFTALLLAQEVLDQNMSLKDPVVDHLKVPSSKFFKKITLFELASYTAALPFNAPALHYNAEDSPYNHKLLNRFLRRWHPQYPAGQRELYSNIGFGILGQALSTEDEMPLPALMQQLILEPLGMNHSGLDLAPSDLPQLAQGFTAEGQPTKTHASGLLAGAWAMKASSHDMENYLKAALLLSVPEVPENIRQAMQLSQMSYYTMLNHQQAMGLAWKITVLNPQSLQALTHRPQHPGPRTPELIHKLPQPQFESNAVIGKTGATDGFRSYIAVFPARQAGIVVLTNRFTESNSHLTNLANRLLLEVPL